jgi:hypothetical protein
MENIKTLKLKNKCDLKQVYNVKNIDNSDFTHEKHEIRHIKPPKLNNDFMNMSMPIVNLRNENPLTVDEVKEKRKIIIQIKNYVREFPQVLQDFSTIDFNSKSIHDLNNYLEEIKITVCNRNSGGLLIGAFKAGCNVLENVAPVVGFDLTGLGNIAIENKAIVDSVKEISLEYQNLNYIPPEKRLALMMLQMCYALNSVNKYNKKMDNTLEKNIDENINDKYSDL